MCYYLDIMLDLERTGRTFRLDAAHYTYLGTDGRDSQAERTSLQELLSQLPRNQDHTCTAAEAIIIIDQIVGRGGDRAITLDTLMQHAQTLILVLMQNLALYSSGEISTFVETLQTTIDECKPSPLGRDSDSLRRLNSAIDEMTDPLKGRPAGGSKYGVEHPDPFDDDDTEPLN
jgi:hypothetical protein